MNPILLTKIASKDPSLSLSSFKTRGWRGEKKVDYTRGSIDHVAVARRGVVERKRIAGNSRQVASADKRGGRKVNN